MKLTAQTAPPIDLASEPAGRLVQARNIGNTSLQSLNPYIAGLETSRTSEQSYILTGAFNADTVKTIQSNFRKAGKLLEPPVSVRFAIVSNGEEPPLYKLQYQAVAKIVRTRRPKTAE